MECICSDDNRHQSSFSFVWALICHDLSSKSLKSHVDLCCLQSQQNDPRHSFSAVRSTARARLVGDSGNRQADGCAIRSYSKCINTLAAIPRLHRVLPHHPERLLRRLGSRTRIPKSFVYFDVVQGVQIVAEERGWPSLEFNHPWQVCLLTRVCLFHWLFRQCTLFHIVSDASWLSICLWACFKANSQSYSAIVFYGCCHLRKSRQLQISRWSEPHLTFKALILTWPLKHSSWVVAIPCILGSRLLLNIRERYFTAQSTEMRTSTGMQLTTIIITDHWIRDMRLM